MPKARWILSSPDVPNPMKQNGKGDSVSVYSRKDLKRRQNEAKKLGYKTSVRKIKD